MMEIHTLYNRNTLSHSNEKIDQLIEIRHWIVGAINEMEPFYFHLEKNEM